VIRYFSILLLAIIAGCVSPPERQAAPESVAIPGDWKAVSNTNVVVASWWNSFGSTQVVDVVTKAMTNNYDLQAALARMDISAAESRIAGADLYPQIGADFDAARSKQNFIGLPIPGAGNDPLSTTFNSYGLRLATTWELDLWGRIRSGQKAAIADMQASQADYFALQQSIAAQTVKSWLVAVELRRQIALTEQVIDSYTTTVRQVKRRYQRGVANSVDYRLAMTDLEGAKASRSKWRAQYEAAVRQLDFLLGQYPDGLLDVQFEFPELTTEIPTGLPSELLERRPDLIAAERRLAASFARVKQAKRSLFPRISLTASGGTSSGDLSELTNPDFSVWTLAANAAQPIFQGGRLIAGIDMAKAANRAAVADYGRSLLMAFTEVETALSVEDDLANREKHLAEAAKQARGSLTRADERYTSGLESILAVLQAQRNVFTAESALINVQRIRLDNRVDLHLALGGGYPAELNPPIPVEEKPVQVSKSK
jgi:multidrug efflux system outer membrane protein